MYKSFSMELAGRTLTVDVGRVAKQANGAAFMHYGDTVVLSTATASEKPRDGIDFFPLSVEYEEKMYAVGKIPGGFNKREGKASEHAILTSRVIDRPMRPLFPKDYRNDVTLNNMVMSVDPECDPEVVAMLGSAIATCISDIPFDGPVCHDSDRYDRRRVHRKPDSRTESRIRPETDRSFHQRESHHDRSRSKRDSGSKNDRRHLQSTRSKPGNHQIHRQHRSRGWKTETRL